MLDSRTSSRDEKATVHDDPKPSKRGFLSSQKHSNEKAIDSKDEDVEPVENHLVPVPFLQLFR